METERETPARCTGEGVGAEVSVYRPPSLYTLLPRGGEDAVGLSVCCRGGNISLRVV